MPTEIPSEDVGWGDIVKEDPIQHEMDIMRDTMVTMICRLAMAIDVNDQLRCTIAFLQFIIQHPNTLQYFPNIRQNVVCMLDSMELILTEEATIKMIHTTDSEEGNVERVLILLQLDFLLRQIKETFRAPLNQ